MPVAAALLALAWAGGGTAVEDGARSGAVLAVHVALMLAGFAGLTLAAAMAALYLWQERRLKRHERGVLRVRVPPLDALDRLAARTVLGSLALLTLGIVVGAARFHRGDFDVAMAVTLAVWATYASLLVLRHEGWRGRRAARLNLLGLRARRHRPSADPLRLMSSSRSSASRITALRSSCGSASRSTSRRAARWPSGCGGEAVVLSTCNRTELYLEREEDAENEAVAAITELAGDRSQDLAAALYRLRDEAAALHLFRVAAGLDSLVPGEGEILGQVRSAFEAGEPGPLLDRLFRQALHTGRRVRIETAIGESPASVPSAAAALAQQVFGELDGRRVLLLGAGKISEATARNLVSRGAEIAVVANRTIVHGEELARKLGARALALDAVAAELEHVDVVVSATSAAGVVVSRETVAHAFRVRKGRPLAARRPRRTARPRSGHQRARRVLPLRRRRPPRRWSRRRCQAAAARQRARSGSSPRRPSAFASGTRRSTSSRRSPRCARSPRRSATASSRAAGGRLSETERRHVESVTSQILAKLLHLPTIRMKEAAAAADGVVYADVVRHLFGLGEEERRR